MGFTDRGDWKARVEGTLATYENQFHSLKSAIEKLTSQFERLTLTQPGAASPVFSSSDSPPSPSPTHRRETPICLPELYVGDPASCRSFLIQCSLHFTHQPSAFPSEDSKVAFVLSLLSGPARDWGAAEWARESLICNSFREFSEELTRTFNPAKPRKKRRSGFPISHKATGQWQNTK